MNYSTILSVKILDIDYNSNMKVTQEIIDEIFDKNIFDGTCPFADVGVECGKGCMTVEECNKCKWVLEQNNKE